MTKDRTTKESLVLFCRCAYYDIIPEASKESVFGGLQAAGVDVEAVADLCGLAAGGDARLERWARAESLAIVACFPRAVRWLFERASAPLEMSKVRFFNMRTQSPEEILGELVGQRPPSDATGVDLPAREEGWVPWYPVIDYDRCRNCKQCLNFCLFGTYGLSDEGRVEVQNPSGCKTNCPACARICPAQAIIFPKYAESPINGDDVTEAAQVAEQATPDLRSLLQGNVYDRIRNRRPGRKRFSTEPSERLPDRGESSLAGLKKQLDIPDDVLASLSPAELQRIRKTSSTGQKQKGSE